MAILTSLIVLQIFAMQLGALQQQAPCGDVETCYKSLTALVKGRSLALSEHLLLTLPSNELIGRAGS